MSNAALGKYTYSRNVQTTDATVTSLAPIVVPNNSSVQIHGYISAFRTAGTLGATGDVAGYEIKGTFKNIAGTVTQVGATDTTPSNEDQAAWDVAFSISGNIVNINVTGAAGNTISWKSQTDVFKSV